jgi:hypothetical protein
MEALSHCRIVCVAGFRAVMHHAAPTASRHLFMAVSWEVRCIRAEVRLPYDQHAEAADADRESGGRRFFGEARREMAEGRLRPGPLDGGGSLGQ